MSAAASTPQALDCPEETPAQGPSPVGMPLITPSVSSPQHSMVPVLVMAQVCCAPQLTLLHVFPRGGVVCPQVLSPQQMRSPKEVGAQANGAPQHPPTDTSVKSPCEAEGTSTCPTEFPSEERHATKPVALRVQRRPGAMSTTARLSKPPAE